MSEGKTITLRLARSPIGSLAKHKRTVRALGLHKLGQEVERADEASVRGMVASVTHLVEIVEKEG